MYGCYLFVQKVYSLSLFLLTNSRVLSWVFPCIVDKLF